MVCISFREMMILKIFSQQLLLLLKENRKNTQKSNDLIKHSIMKSKDVWGVSKKIKVDPCLIEPQYIYKYYIFTYIYVWLYLL